MNKHYVLLEKDSGSLFCGFLRNKSDLRSKEPHFAKGTPKVVCTLAPHSKTAMRFTCDILISSYISFLAQMGRFFEPLEVPPFDFEVDGKIFQVAAKRVEEIHTQRNKDTYTKFAALVSEALKSRETVRKSRMATLLRRKQSSEKE
jgi:hypothetical protein